MKNTENLFNILTILLTITGFIIGFINEEYRLLAWTFSFLLIIVIISFMIISEYVSKIEKNEKDIQELKKDLNIGKRLIILETRTENLKRR